MSPGGLRRCSDLSLQQGEEEHALTANTLAPFTSLFNANPPLQSLPHATRTALPTPPSQPASPQFLGGHRSCRLSAPSGVHTTEHRAQSTQHRAALPLHPHTGPAALGPLGSGAGQRSLLSARVRLPVYCPCEAAVCLSGRRITTAPSVTP